MTLSLHPHESTVEVAEAGTAQTCDFILQSQAGSLLASGCMATLPQGNAESVGMRVRGFFANQSQGPSLLVGALPFDRRHADHLYQPARVQRSAKVESFPLRASVELDASVRKWHVVPEPPPQAFAERVARCVALLREQQGVEGGLRKVVLSRSLRIEGGAPIDPRWLAARLARDGQATTYLAPLPVDAHGPVALVGATPELLLSRRGRQVLSNPLAGSAPRHADPVRDRAAADALQASRKDHEEHRWVVESILDTLAPLCSDLSAPPRPSLQGTASMWHLGTRIGGTLRDDTLCAAALAALLQPTPATCGFPRETAGEVIAELEPNARGFYAGAVGWTDAAGDGDWHVAIRCAEQHERSLRLHAGAGIVADSDPALETAETAAKFATLLDALGLGDNTAPPQELSV